MRHDGVEIVVAQADISRREDVLRVLSAAEDEARPLKGIVHAAGINDDGVLAEQRWVRFEKVMAAKMAGAWHLHEAAGTRGLDFFVLFSSMVSLFGGPGQSNYAAANGFLDGLARYRRSRGLPGLTVNWGPWAGDGMAGRVSERDRQRWRAEGYGMIPPARGVALLGALLRRPAPAAVAALPIDWPVLFRQFTPGGEPPILKDLAAGYAKHLAAKPQERQRLSDVLRDVPPTRRRAAVAGFLKTIALKVLGLDAAAPLDERQPLSELGLDSLMAVELRNAIAAAMERALPATLLFRHPTLEGLCQFVMEEVGGQEVPAHAVDADARSVAAMSDDEAKALLAEELESLTLSDLTAEERN
jgi:acyl carrier protein